MAKKAANKKDAAKGESQPATDTVSPDTEGQVQDEEVNDLRRNKRGVAQEASAADKFIHITQMFGSMNHQGMIRALRDSKSVLKEFENITSVTTNEAKTYASILKASKLSDAWVRALRRPWARRDFNATEVGHMADTKTDEESIEINLN